MHARERTHMCRRTPARTQTCMYARVSACEHPRTHFCTHALLHSRTSARMHARSRTSTRTQYDDCLLFDVRRAATHADITLPAMLEVRTHACKHHVFARAHGMHACTVRTHDTHARTHGTHLWQARTHARYARHATPRHTTPHHATPRHASVCSTRPHTDLRARVHAHTARTHRHMTEQLPAIIDPSPACSTQARHTAPHQATPRHAAPCCAMPRHTTPRSTHAMVARTPRHTVAVCVDILVHARRRRCTHASMHARVGVHKPATRTCWRKHALAHARVRARSLAHLDARLAARLDALFVPYIFARLGAHLAGCTRARRTCCTRALTHAPAHAHACSPGTSVRARSGGDGRIDPSGRRWMEAQPVRHCISSPNIFTSVPLKCWKARARTAEHGSSWLSRQHGHVF